MGDEPESVVGVDWHANVRNATPLGSSQVGLEASVCVDDVEDGQAKKAQRENRQHCGGG